MLRPGSGFMSVKVSSRVCAVSGGSLARKRAAVETGTVWRASQIHERSGRKGREEYTPRKLESGAG
jgi:hypothetical protein